MVGYSKALIASRAIRVRAVISFLRATVSAVKPPCFSAFLLPLGAPPPAPCADVAHGRLPAFGDVDVLNDHALFALPSRRSGGGLKEIEALFVQVLLLAREMGVLKLGTLGIDGTKIHANASRHSALSYEHAGKIEAQLKAEVAELMAKAEATNAADVPDGLSIPEELARREERLQKMAASRSNA